MHYNFIEIGTANFDTILQTTQDNSVGISVEPIKHLLDQLPNRHNVIKLNIAISDRDGEIKIYYVKQEIIDKYKLPWWFIGSSSVGDIHPGISRVLKEMNIDPETVVNSMFIPTKRLGSLIKEYNITSLDMLKIDTEGHDTIILIDYLSECINKNFPLPKTIHFEHNGLYSEEEYIKVKNIGTKLGYNVIEYVADTVMTRK